ncbi:MAG: DUF4199 domain-containing protein [Bacteroidales bacterium]|nr:DUF4199 domain-containing protein [Bacteroidales bacterium]
MRKKLISNSLRWGILIGFFQILSHYLLVYVFQDASINSKNLIEVLTLIIGFACIYASIRAYKQSFELSDKFPLLQAFFAGVLPAIVFACIFSLYFILLTKVIDKEFMSSFILTDKSTNTLEGQALMEKARPLTPFIYLIKYNNHYLFYQFMAALLMAFFMQRKIEEPPPQNDNNENN